MGTRKIVAIGGGENGMVKSDGTKIPYETEGIDAEIVKLTGKEHPNFLFLGHGVDLAYQEGYFRTMEKIYGEKFGCICKDLKSDLLSNTEKVKGLVEWADIIYEGGGSTADVMEVWQENGFDEILKNAWKKGKVMCGLSAGANCRFKECSSDSLQIKYGDDKQPLIKVECLGLADGLFVPHCDEEGRQEHVKQLLKNESDEIGLLFSNCAALEIIDDEYRVLTTETSKELNRSINKGYGKKTYRKDDEYKEEILDDSPEFKKLSELYSKL